MIIYKNFVSFGLQAEGMLIVTIGGKTLEEKEEIHLGDIKRILFGQAPPEFLIEVFLEH